MEKIINNLKIIAKKFPNSPGVYFFRDKTGRPIYIGLAGFLKRRIASYFCAKEPRIIEMVEAAYSLDFQKTDTLLEAVILEANLIKKYWPKYNVVDKDDRSFIYLVILPGDYPRPMIVRGRELEKYKPVKAKVFGPFESFYILKTVLSLIRRIFPYSTCKPLNGKPCFDYQIGLCPGACIGAITPKEYKNNIKNIELFFKGQKVNLIKKLKKENPEKITALSRVQDVALLAGSSRAMGSSGLLTSGRIEGYDISHLSGKEPVGAMVVFENGEKNSSQYRLFKIKSVAAGRNYNDLEMMKEVLTRRFKHAEWQRPEIVFVDGGISQVKIVREVLAKNNIFAPVVGLAKTGGHSASAYTHDKLVIANSKKSVRELILASKMLFQSVRNEAHRFAINYNIKKRNNFNF
ncbi:MAG: Excinuclease ABC subunit C [Parcubacteria group bacterium Athens0714_26]|nr:MAG: Excinuclease ABC subunit C [Parcubacteria group bacterium Athens1014_26]TSD02534.1 MAG: Excinuclease ABC subunit C [Parcubacteria group bacterium Athens0714_26]